MIIYGLCFGGVKGNFDEIISCDVVILMAVSIEMPSLAICPLLFSKANCLALHTDYFEMLHDQCCFCFGRWAGLLSAEVARRAGLGSVGTSRRYRELAAAIPAHSDRNLFTTKCY